VRAAAWRSPLWWSGQEPPTRVPVVTVAALLGLVARDRTRLARTTVTGP
jgi:hypothetical protein